MNALQKSFLDTIAPLAQAAQMKWGPPASVQMAQAIIESANAQGWGQSQLTREANNPFGIKAAHCANPDSYIKLPTHEYVNGECVTVEAEFARYDSLADSFDAHARLLATAPRYAHAMAVRRDPTAFCTQLQHAGYSTSPTYASSLWKLIQLYDLTQYDVLPDGPAREVAA